MCKYYAWKGAQTSTLKCESTLLSKGPPTATVMCKYLVFKGTPNSNYNFLVGYYIFNGASPPSPTSK